jgi:isopenicillin-N epimerase
MLTPKGCSFLYIKKEFQPFDPLLISWGFEAEMPLGSQFIDHHQQQGTRDYSAFLTIPKAIQFRAENDWRTVTEKCRSLVMANAESFSEAAGGELLSSISDDFLGQMCAVRINCSDPIRLHDTLYVDYNIEVPVMQHGDSVFIRFSINGYNLQEDIDKLCLALEEVKSTSNLLI